MTRATNSLVPSWPECQLKDLVDDRGITYGIVQPGQPQAEGVPILRVNNFRSGGLELDDVMRVAPEVAARFKRSTLRGGEVLITLVGSTGQVAVAPSGLSGWNVARAVGVVPVRDRDSARWVAWCLEAPSARAYLDARLNTTVQSTLNLRDLASLSIPMPPAAERDAIASVLGAIDNKIDSNRRLAGLLEETAATLFSARFVDFVGVEEFEESESGRIPRGWRVVALGDLLTIVGGSTPSTKESRFWNGAHCWATPKDLSGARSPILLDTERHITDDGVSRISSRLLPPRTVLLSSRAPVGYTAISFVPIAVNQGFIAIPPSDEVPSEFVFFWLREHMDVIKAHAGGTTFAEISKRQFRPLPMIVPTPTELDEFQRAAAPAFDLMAGLEAEVRSLTELRDALLPKLISGQIRVPDTADPAEMIVPATEAVAAAL